MVREGRDEYGARGDGVHELEREELARADEAAVVLVDEEQREEGEDVREDEVRGEVGVRVADEVEPVVWGGCVVRGGVDDGATEESRPVLLVAGPVAVVVV